MADWKPTYWRTNGKRGTTDALRKVGIKLLENMKYRNEEVGNYANPVQRFSYDGIKFMVSSLPGYDIIDITAPFEEGEEEKFGTAELYSGLWEPRHQASGQQHYLRWYPSGYELYNSDSIAPVVRGASVDGAEDYLDTAPMPPIRWMKNDYTYDPEDPLTKQEAPWFVDSGPTVSATSIHPGKYSGRLRELVQMQLGYGLLPQFSYTASNSNGIYLEDLGDDVTRIWLYQISGTNGIVMQIMMDYSIENFEKAADLKTGAIPPEVEDSDFFALQTSFDSSRVAYTKAEYDAIPEDERPAISTVTFTLLSSAAYLSVVSEYGAYGDYGWSFNPAGTSAVFCGMAWSDTSGNAPNYKSNLLTVTLNPTAYSASVSGAGDNLFLMDSSFDHVKFPNSDGTLETVYFWKGENGFKGTQPSTSYTAPIYVYYDLNGALVTCSYQWEAGSYTTLNGGSAFVLGWTETYACRQHTTLGATGGIYANNYHFRDCTTGKSGTGTFGYKHGFTTEITTPDSYDIFSGYEADWTTTHPWGDLPRSTTFKRAAVLKVVLNPTQQTSAYTPCDEQFVAVSEGSFSGSTKSVLIVPSFERLAYYHYKSLNTTLTSGKIRYPHQYAYERGDNIRQGGLGGSLGDDCEQAQCGWPLPGLGILGERHPELEGAAEYYMASGPQRPSGNNADAFVRLTTLYPGCSPNNHDDCFGGNDAVLCTTPNDEVPATRDNTTLVGGLRLPNGDTIMYSDAEIDDDSEPFRESSSSFGYQSVISCFDTFSSKYIFSMPNIALTATKHTATGFPDDITKTGVLFSGMPYFTG